MLPSLVTSHLSLAGFFVLLDCSLHTSKGLWRAVATTTPLPPIVCTRTGLLQSSCISPILFKLFASSYLQDDHLALANTDLPQLLWYNPNPSPLCSRHAGSMVGLMFGIWLFLSQVHHNRLHLPTLRSAQNNPEVCLVNTSLPLDGTHAL